VGRSLVSIDLYDVVSGCDEETSVKMVIGSMEIFNHVLNVGHAIPVVLIHAFPVDHRMWIDCAQQLVQQCESAGLKPFSIYAPDMPGAGSSPVPTPEESGIREPDGAYSQALDLIAQSYVRMISELGHQQAIWVGLSMGGYVVSAIQRLYPESVAGLAFCDTTVSCDSPNNRAERIRIAQQCEKENNVDAVMSFAVPQSTDSSIKRSQEFITKFTGWISSQNPKGVAWRERMAAGRPDQATVLPTITVPTVIVSGQLDPSSPPEKMSSIVTGITSTDTTFITIPDCGHFSAVEHPDQVAAALFGLVESVQQHTDDPIVG
jgi:pimeloyl-ACP methyl ester carboxylesterase